MESVLGFRLLLGNRKKIASLYSTLFGLEFNNFWINNLTVDTANNNTSQYSAPHPTNTAIETDKGVHA
jgi:hypothetical protein